MKRLLIACALIACLAGCRSAPSADERFRQHFQAAQLKEVTPETARQTLLAQLPPGTPEKEIYAYLQRSGIGQDGLSSFFKAGDDGRIFCNIQDDPRSYHLFGSNRRGGYAVVFVLDDLRRLKDVTVQPWNSEA